MAGSVNKAIIIGNLGKDPEVRTGQDGKKFANFSVATLRNLEGPQYRGEERKDRMAPGCHLQRPAGGCCRTISQEGNKVYVEGQLTTREWTDKDGQKRYTTEIVINQFRGDLTLMGSAASSGSGAAMAGVAAAAVRAVAMAAPMTMVRAGRAAAAGGYRLRRISTTIFPSETGTAPLPHAPCESQ